MMKGSPKMNTGLLVLRVGIGALFIMAGWMKVADMHATVGMFASMGINTFWAYVASYAELLGGVAVLLGVFTHFAAAVLAFVMLVAVYETRSNMQMMMTPAVTLFASLALAFTGAGRYSVGSLMNKSTAEKAQ